MFREAGWEWPLVESASAGDLKYLLQESPVADALLRAKAAACLFSRPEWQMLFVDEAEFVIDRSYLLDKTPRMRQAVEADDGALFMVELALQGRRITKGMVQTLILKEKYNILQELIRQPKEFAKAYPPGKLMFLLLDGVFLSKSRSRLLGLPVELRRGPYVVPCMAVIRSLEQAFPGMVKNTRDSHGADALWHLLMGSHDIMLYDEKTTSAPRQLEELLISLGCDPNRPHEAMGGLSYAQVAEAYWELAQG